MASEHANSMYQSTVCTGEGRGEEGKEGGEKGRGGEGKGRVRGGEGKEGEEERREGADMCMKVMQAQRTKTVSITFSDECQLDCLCTQC